MNIYLSGNLIFSLIYIYIWKNHVMNINSCACFTASEYRFTSVFNRHQTSTVCFWIHIIIQIYSYFILKIKNKKHYVGSITLPIYKWWGRIPFYHGGEGVIFYIHVYIHVYVPLKWADLFSSLIYDWIVNCPLKYIN